MTGKMAIVFIVGLFVFLCISVYQDGEVRTAKEKTKQIQMQLEIKKCQ